MTSLFSVVSFHWFVLLAHWSPCAPLLNPSSSSPGPPPCLLIDTRADGVSSAGGKMCSLHPPVTTTAFMGVGSPVTRRRHRYVIFISDFLMFCKAGLHSASFHLHSAIKIISVVFSKQKIWPFELPGFLYFIIYATELTRLPLKHKIRTTKYFFICSVGPKMIIQAKIICSY